MTTKRFARRDAWLPFMCRRPSFRMLRPCGRYRWRRRGTAWLSRKFKVRMTRVRTCLGTVKMIFLCVFNLANSRRYVSRQASILVNFVFFVIWSVVHFLMPFVFVLFEFFTRFNCPNSIKLSKVFTSVWFCLRWQTERDAFMRRNSRTRISNSCPKASWRAAFSLIQ